MPTAEKQANAPSTATNVTTPATQNESHAIPRCGFSVQHKEIWHDGQKLGPGVWLHSTWKTNAGEQTSHEWICAPLQAKAITRSLNNTDYGRLICFMNLDGQEQQWAMPRSIWTSWYAKTSQPGVLLCPALKACI